MEIKQIENRLNIYRKVTNIIKHKNSLLGELRGQQGLQASKLSEVHIKGARASKDEILSNKILDIEEEIKELKKRELQAFDAVINLIDMMDNDLYKRILFARFINFKDWGEIANSINYSYTHTKVRLYNNALNELQRMINKN